MQYRGHEITVTETYVNVSAVSDQYEAWTEGGEWTCNGLCGFGKNAAEAIEELKAEIDEYEESK
jgi:hypothetical protein